MELLDCIVYLENALGRTATKELIPLQDGDVPDTYAKIEDLIKQFNYKPTISIEEGINRFVSWYRDYFKM